MRYLLYFFALLFSSVGVAEHYTVLVYHGANPPYNFIVNGKQSGIFSDLFVRLSELTGHTFELVPWSVARGQKQFDLGKIDIEPGVNPSWRVEGVKPAIYSRAYAYSREVVLGRKDALVVDNPVAFYGKVFGRVRGYRYGEFEAHFGTDKIMVYDNTSEKELLFQLAHKRIDCVMIGDATAAYYQKRNSDYAEFKALYEISKLPVHMRLQPHLKRLQKELDEALSLMRHNKEIEKIYQRYGAISN
ncbi:transporter substrate-binding domain-containing protein [Pseudoalteromonas luteoviolacea]|uniref:substrate-binding periplasmic protein n=1 Tax=Pseudoalteromonas luteoviolacea TaxID=43657 RepID=UPI001F33567F|nr:transporter substrate-binding domain-containing protein [Pseudoalteromonas luteoviolacea]MCF6441391.1 transporter substrate-binding domain-containing protein [Pseudoalteromonas luteoviolacea]